MAAVTDDLALRPQLGRLIRRALGRVFGYRPPAELPLSTYARILASRPRGVPAPLSIPKGARIAVVGNGPVRAEQGPVIDAHDIVIRFNYCQHYGLGGFRTDVLVLVNRGDSARRYAYRRGSIPLPCLRQAREIWFKRGPDALTPADDNYAEEIIRRRFRSRPWRYVSQEVRQYAASLLIKHGAAENKAHAPSAGFLALCQIKRHHPSARVTLFGFTHEGWEAHPWAAERSAVDHWSDWVTRADQLQPLERQSSVA
jgi:hypothetical protein